MSFDVNGRHDKKTGSGHHSRADLLTRHLLQVLYVVKRHGELIARPYGLAHLAVGQRQVCQVTVPFADGKSRYGCENHSPHPGVRKRKYSRGTVSLSVASWKRLGLEASVEYGTEALRGMCNKRAANTSSHLRSGACTSLRI